MRLPHSLSHSPSLRSLQSLITTAALVLSFAPPQAAAQTYQLNRNPKNVRFGSMLVQQQEVVPVSLTNSGSSSVTISAVSASNPEFSVANLSLPMALAAGQSINVNLTFTPTVAGWAEGTLSFASNASNATLYIGVGGVGIGSESLTPSPAALSFGNVSV